MREKSRGPRWTSQIRSRFPADHRLWNAPNLLITPHVSGGFSLPETLEKIVGLFADNLERYFAGQPIENLVNLQTGYRE